MASSTSPSPRDRARWRAPSSSTPWSCAISARRRSCSYSDCERRLERDDVESTGITLQNENSRSSPATALLGSNRQPAFVPLDDSFETRIVFDEALAAQTQEVVPKAWILEIYFQELLIGDGENLAVLDTLDGLGPTVVGRQKSELPDHTTGTELDSDLRHAELAGDDIEHLVRRISLAKEHVVLAILPPRHE